MLRFAHLRFLHQWPWLVLLAMAVLIASDGERHEQRAATARVAQSIDTHIDIAIAEAGFTASGTAEDAEFFRRVHLDLIGRVPDAEAARRFLADRRADKRARIIDELLDSQAFARRLADIWDGLLYDSTGYNASIDNRPFTQWLEDRFARHQPWDAMVRDILTATGRQYENGAVSPFVGSGKPHEAASLTTRALLGVQLECAQCHNHPYADFTREDFWSMAAFFNQLDRRSEHTAEPRSEYFRAAMTVGVDIAIEDSTTPLEFEEVDGMLDVEPRFLDRTEPDMPQDGLLRPALATWMTSPDNPWFAKATVNRIWGQLMGRGLIHPVDDLKRDDTPSHPEVLALLTEQFIASGFDLRAVYRTICNSKAYQRSSRPTDDNASDDKFYSRALIKVFTAEQLFDSLATILGPHEMFDRPAYADDPDMARFDGFRKREEFVVAMTGDPERSPTDYRRGIPHALTLMNSDRIETSIRRRVEDMLATPGESAAYVDELYLAALGRYPSADQRRRMLNFVRTQPDDPVAAYSGVLWALLNSSEFQLNH